MTEARSFRFFEGALISWTSFSEVDSLGPPTLNPEPQIGQTLHGERTQ